MLRFLLLAAFSVSAFCADISVKSPEFSSNKGGGYTYDSKTCTAYFNAKKSSGNWRIDVITSIKPGSLDNFAGGEIDGEQGAVVRFIELLKAAESNIQIDTINLNINSCREAWPTLRKSIAPEFAAIINQETKTDPNSKVLYLPTSVSTAVEKFVSESPEFKAIGERLARSCNRTLKTVELSQNLKLENSRMYGKTWGELAKDPDLGISPTHFVIRFVFEASK